MRNTGLQRVGDRRTREVRLRRRRWAVTLVSAAGLAAAACGSGVESRTAQTVGPGPSTSPTSHGPKTSFPSGSTSSATPQITITIPPTTERPAAGTPELAKGGNGRFCFLFDYPTTWTRKDPDNGDGTWFTDPRIDVQVQATFSGHGGHVDQKPLSEDEASWEEHLNWQPKKWEVLDSRPANGYSLSPSNNDRPVDNLPGWRMTLKSTEGVQDPQMEVRQLLDDDGTHITFTGEAPESVFSEYEPLFAELAASLAGNDDCLGD